MNDSTTPFTLPHRLADAVEASAQLRAAANEFAVIENPGVPFPGHDIVPLAPKRLSLDGLPQAVLIDMDGTTTTTEDLCCQGMEEMVRRMGGLDSEQWPGLNAEIDCPALIGYSALKNFEYLRHTYGHLIDEQHTLRAFLEAAAWNLGPQADPAVRDSVERRFRSLSLRPVLEDARFNRLRAHVAADAEIPAELLSPLIETHAERLHRLFLDDPAQVGLAIYCENYHRRLSAPVGAPESDGIHPNPGVGVFLALVKGLLGREAAVCVDILIESLRRDGLAAPDSARARALLGGLGERFQHAPPRLALVTSSSAYEARHVLRHLFHHLTAELERWGLSYECLDRVREAFSEPSLFYDAIITSSDIPPARLKPHRDPYATALRQLEIGSSSLGRVIGFEDTEPGIVSLRGAGVGLAVAVPIPGTQTHDFGAAAHVVKGGFPEVLLKYRYFLST